MWTNARCFKFGLPLLALTIVGFSSAAPARADVTVLLEEPYSYDGALAGTGHTAVYLNRVCAETPVELRRCRPGEHGAVISRYARVGGYDWIAIPLVPYLYAVENPEDIPLYADAKLEAFLRDQYRRDHLEAIAPDLPDGSTPKGDWYELVGSSYDRTNYGYEIETTAQQDDAFIAWMNAQPNHTDYHVVTRNCANFVRDVLDFYYPHASPQHGSFTDLWVSTPKYEAKSLTHYSKSHRDLEFTRFVIPQVPGTVKRSRPVRGVLESLIRAKKYVIVFAAFHPVIGGGLITADLIGDRFNPARNSPVFNLSGAPLAPPTKAEKRAYRKQLQAAVASGGSERRDDLSEPEWRSFVEKSHPALDGSGQPVLETFGGAGADSAVELGVARSDFGSDGAPVELQRELLVARMKQTLAGKRAPRISSSELREDWLLLQKIDGGDAEVISKNVEPQGSVLTH